MKHQKRNLKRLMKSKAAVSQVLAAIMIIFMFVAAIGVVWAWLYPAYNQFQTTNNINSMTSYMLRVDEAIYDLYGMEPGSIDIVRMDPNFGFVRYEEGKNVSLQFADAAGTYNQSFLFTKLGVLAFLLENRRGVILKEGESSYLKGPNTQRYFFVNGSTTGETYQGLTNLTLMRPADKSMKISLDYRVRVYTWFDQTANILSITVNILQLAIKGTSFSFGSYHSLKIAYNTTGTIYAASTTVSSDFYVGGSINDFAFRERPLTFVKPGSVGSYTVDIAIQVSQFLFYY
ncbi:MAG: hypothetical protein ACTSXO_05345 [Candidatus Heimdallarchaeota archaeon]